jgi:von Willebrand factor type A domain
MRSMRFLLTTVLALGLAGGSAALPAGGAQLGSAQDNSLRRTIAMSAHTDQGWPVNGLLPGNLRAKMDGREIKILSCDYDTGPHRVVFVFDVSASMDEVRFLEETFAGNLLGMINPSSPVAVLTFGTNIIPRVQFTMTRGAARAEVENLNYIPANRKEKRRTALFDSIEAALKMLEPVQPGDSICLFSDGSDNASKLRELQIRKLVSRTGVRIFPVFIPTRPPSMLLGGSWGSLLLLDLSEDSGGRYFGHGWENMDWTNPKFVAKYPKAAEQQRKTFLASVERVAQPINAFYRVEIQLPEPIDKPSRWKLETFDPNANKHDPKVILHYPARLYPASH